MTDLELSEVKKQTKKIAKQIKSLHTRYQNSWGDNIKRVKYTKQVGELVNQFITDYLLTEIGDGVDWVVDAELLHEFGDDIKQDFLNMVSCLSQMSAFLQQPKINS